MSSLRQGLVERAWLIVVVHLLMLTPAALMFSGLVAVLFEDDFWYAFFAVFLLLWLLYVTTLVVVTLALGTEFVGGWLLNRRARALYAEAAGEASLPADAWDEGESS